MLKNKYTISAGVFALSFVICAYIFFKESQRINISINLTSSKASLVQVFYSDDIKFSGRKSITKKIDAGIALELVFRLVPNINRIRIDPATSPMDLSIKNIYIWKGNKKTKTALNYDCLKPLKDIAEIKKNDKNLITFRSVGSDPQLLINTNCIQFADQSLNISKYILSIVLYSALLSWFSMLVIKNYQQFGSGVLLIAFSWVVLIIFLISIATPYNLHPDEFGHVPAASYFIDNWLKKSFDHPDMQKSIMQNWGSSYLMLNDLVYLIAEKSTVLFSSLFAADYQRYRVFNVLLFIILLILFVKDREQGFPFLLVLGITPQVFYIFSYFNGDAFGLFWCLILGFVFIRYRQRIIDFFWLGGRPCKIIILLCLCSVMIVFSRLNYLIFIPYVAGLVILLKPNHINLMKTLKYTVMRIFLFLILVSMPAILAEFHSQYVNNFSKAELILKQIEQFASPTLSRKVISETGYNPHLLNLRDFGVPLGDLLSSKYNWPAKTWRWFFGMYGYGTFTTPLFFALLNSLAAFFSVSFVLCLKYFKTDTRYFLVGLYSLSFIFATIVQSLMHSWINGFQPQGKYIFAILPMLAVWLSLGPRMMLRRHYSVLVAVNVGISAFGFILYAAIPMILN